MDSGELRRLRDLSDYMVLDTPPEPNFDRIARLAAAIFRKPVCTLSLADAGRHWFKARQGTDMSEMPRTLSFCDVTIAGDQVLVIPDTRSDGRFERAPMVIGSPFLRFYAGAPLLTPRGSRVGSLCVVDVVPDDTFGDDKRAILADLAKTAVELLEARRRQIELARYSREVADLARQDPLTELGNRRQFERIVREAVSRARQGEPVALHFLDLDGFKAVNDSFGHTAGDHLLQKVADRLLATVGPAAHVARIGGDEFAIIENGAVAVESATLLAECLIDAIATPFDVEGASIKIGVSIGIAIGSGVEADTTSLLRRSDAALYRAKTSGRNRYVLSDRASAERSCAAEAPSLPFPLLALPGLLSDPLSI